MIKLIKGLSLLLLSSLIVHEAVSVDIVGNGAYPKIFGIMLGKHTLNDVQKLFGAVNVNKIGDAASSTNSVCYKVVSKYNPMFDIVFSSDAELAGPPDYELTHAVLYKAGNSINIKDCTNLEVKDGVAIEEDDLVYLLGKSSEKILLDQGESTNSSEHTITNSNCHQIPFKKGIDPHYDYWESRQDCFVGTPYYDACIIKEFTLDEEGKAIVVEVSYTETIC